MANHKQSCNLFSGNTPPIFRQTKAKRGIRLIVRLLFELFWKILAGHGFCVSILFWQMASRVSVFQNYYDGWLAGFLYFKFVLTKVGRPGFLYFKIGPIDVDQPGFLYFEIGPIYVDRPGFLYFEIGPIDVDRPGFLYF